MHRKYFGVWKQGSHTKWCFPRRLSKDGPPWIEFDLVYRRFITRIEVTLFHDVQRKGHQYLDIRRVRFSENGKDWIGYHVSAALEKLGQFALSLVFTTSRR